MAHCKRLVLAPGHAALYDLGAAGSCERLHLLFHTTLHQPRSSTACPDPAAHHIPSRYQDHVLQDAPACTRAQETHCFSLACQGLPPTPCPNPGCHPHRYLSLRPSTQDQFAYVEGCKLLLAHAAEAPADAAAGAAPEAASSTSQAACSLPPGCPHSPEAVLGHFLGFLHQHLQQQLAASFTTEVVQQAELKYCIAIPAGLSDEAKSLVRQ